MALPECRIITVGSSGVGKTSIVNRMVHQSYSNDFESTVGVQYYEVTIDVDDQQTKVQIWDTAGQERFRSVARSYFRNAAGVCLVYDISDAQSFDDLGSWMKDIDAFCAPDTSVLLIGNKSDCSASRAVSSRMAEEFASTNQLKYMETSAKDGSNVQQAFHTLASMIIRKGRTTSTTIISNSASGGKKCC